MQYALKLVHAGFFSDDKRGERISFPDWARSQVESIPIGSKFLIYVTKHGIAGAGEITGTLAEGIEKYGCEGAYPLPVPMRLLLELPPGSELSLGALGGGALNLGGETWVDIEEWQYERALAEMRKRASTPIA